MRFRRRAPGGDAVATRSETELPLSAAGGPVTFAQALERAWPAVAEIDAKAFLTLAASGPSLDAAGRSPVWELFFALPAALARAEVDVHAAPERDRAELGPDRLVRRVRPLLEPGTIPHELWQRGGADEREVLAASMRKQLDPAKALPARFVDSPAAVASFADLGADLDAGSTQRTLVAEHAGDSPTWRLELGPEIYTLPFAAG